MASRERTTRTPPPPVQSSAGWSERVAPLLASAPVRALVARPSLAAALLLALPVLVLLWPALVGGELLAPLSILYRFPPWEAVAPADYGDWFNPLLSDVPMSHYPWNVYAREMIHSGTFPAWNPHAFAGVPFFANPQTVLLSPFSLAMWVLPLNYGIGVAAALKLWAAAFGTYLLVRELRLGFLPALLAGLGFGFCAYNIMWLAHESLPAVSALLPWMLWLAERLLRRGGIGPAIGLAVATGVALTGGHPGTQLHVLAATALYAALRAGTVSELALAVRLRRVGSVALALVLGAMLVGLIFVPELRSSEGTLGTQSRLGGQGTQPGVDMPLEAIKTTLFPDWWGRPSSLEVDSSPEYRLGVNFNERTFYAGAIALLMAFVGLLSRGGWRRKAPFAVLGVAALAIPLDAPLLGWLADHLPGFEVVQNQRMHFVYALAVAVLAAFGLDALLRRPAGERWQLAVPIAGAAAVVAALAAIGPSAGDVGDAIAYIVSGADSRVDEVLALASVAWWLAFVVAVAIALLAFRRWPERATLIAALLVLVAAADALHFAHGYQPTAPASKMVPPATPAIEYLQERRDEGRFLGMMYNLTNDFSSTFGLSDIRGYDPPQPTLRFFELWRVANPEQSDWQPFVIQGLTPAAMNVISALGARFVVADPGTPAVVSDDPAFRPLRQVYDGDDATIYRNAKAVPRVMIAPQVQVTADEYETRALIATPDFDPRETALVEQGEPGAAALADAEPASGSVAIAAEENARVTLRAMLERGGLVMLNDHFTDGWSVAVDGRPAEAVRVNDVMRGVVVDAGEHEITWSYSVPGLRLGLALSAVAFVVLAGGTVALVVRRRRSVALRAEGS